MSRSTQPGPDRGQLVHVADQDQQAAVGGMAWTSVVGQQQVHHAGLVDDEHVAFQRVVGRRA